MTKIDFNRYFNDINYQPSDFYSKPPPESVKTHSDPINLSGGRPNSGFYPIKKIQLTLKDEPFNNDDTNDASNTIEITNDDETTLNISNALQYGPPKGHEELLKFIKNLNDELNPPKHSYELDYFITTGSGDSFFRILQVLLKPGDTILIENFTYTPIFGPIDSLGGVKIPYNVDFESDKVIDLNYLSNLLQNWDDFYPNNPKPKLIYTVPTQNPSGLTQPLETRLKLYEIAQLHDLIILEDDPDGYIRLKDLDDFDSYAKQLKNSSYQSIDTDGRVLRFETFSKLFAPGLRIGFLIGLKEFIDKIVAYSKVGFKATSGIGQLIVYNTIKQLSYNVKETKLLTDPLVKGYLTWDYKVSLEYSKRFHFIKNFIIKKSKSYSKKYINLIEPDGGMFFIIKINFEDVDNVDVVKQLELLRYELLKTGVLTILGNLMTWNESIAQKANFLRLTLANVDSIDVLDQAIQRFDTGIVEFFESN